MTDAAPPVEIVRVGEPDAALGDALVDLQERVWGSEPEDVMPSWRFVVAPRTGGELLIARAAGAMVGFALCSPGIAGGSFDVRSTAPRPHLYLDLLGVRPDQRHARVGERLMRELVRVTAQRGLDRIRWTFDPLEGANANLYLAKLGARGIAFLPNLYGSMARAGQQGERSDRLLAELSVSAGATSDDRGARPSPTTRPAVVLRADTPHASAADLPAHVALAVPASYADLRRCDPAAARAVRLGSGHLLTQLFAAGHLVTGFERGTDHNLLLLER